MGGRVLAPSSNKKDKVFSSPIMIITCLHITTGETPCSNECRGTAQAGDDHVLQGCDPIVSLSVHTRRRSEGQ